MRGRNGFDSANLPENFQFEDFDQIMEEAKGRGSDAGGRDSDRGRGRANSSLRWW